MNTTKMKAIAITGYGSPEVLTLKEFEKPIPKDKEVLVKIFVFPVTTAATMMRKGTPFFARFFLGLNKPANEIPGTGLAGEIEAIGKDVKQFKVGDKVFGETLFDFSANAEYVCVPEDGLLETIPPQFSYAEVAAVCDGPLTSMSFLKDMANIQPGHRVLIIGASGSLGTAAVQIARHFGAEVTGVCSTTNLEMVKRLGANSVIDYTKTDFTKNGEIYDVIYDTLGLHPFSKCAPSLSAKGKYLSPVLNIGLLFQMIKTTITGGKKAIFSATGARAVSRLKVLLKEVKELMKIGRIKMIIDKQYSLEQVVDAHRYVDTGHKKGNVVINIANT